MAEKQSFDSPERTKGLNNSGSSSGASLKEYVEATYNSNPPQLVDTVQDFPQLQKLAQLIHEELTAGGEGESGQVDLNVIDQAVRHLFNDFYELKYQQDNQDGNDANAKSFVDYTSLLAQNPSDVNIANLQITELKRQINVLKSDCETYKRERKQANADLDAMIQKNAKLNKEKEDLKTQNLKEITDYQHQVRELEDKLFNNDGQTHQYGETISQLKSQMRSLEDDLEVSRRENAAIKERLEQKNKLINELRMRIKHGDQKYEQLEQEKAESEMTLSSQLITQRSIQDQKTRAALTKLIKHNKKQSKELEAVIEANHRAASVIEKQEQLLDEYTDRTACYEQDLQTAYEDLNEMREQMDETNGKNGELTSVLESRTEELTELRSIVSDCMDIVGAKHSITQEQLPELINELSMQKIDPETEETLEKLTALTDGLTRLVVQLMRDGNGNVTILKEKQEPVLKDSNMKLDILNEIAAIRQDLSRITFSSAEEDPVMRYLDGMEKEIDLNEQTQFSAAAVLAAVSQRFREYADYEIGELVKIRQVLPFVCSDAELPSAVAQYLLELQPVFQKLLDVISKTLHYHGSTEDIFQCLCKYVEETSNMMTELDDLVRPLIGFSGKIVSMPAVIAEALTDMKAQLDQHRKGVSEELTNSMIQSDKEKSQFKRKITELDDLVHRNQSIIDTLQTQLDKTASQLQESQTSMDDLEEKSQATQRTVEQLKESNQALEITKEMLLKDRERMEETMKQRQDAHSQRMEQAVMNERKLSEEEIERQKKKYEEEIQQLSMQISKTTKKLTLERKKSQEKTVLYNELSHRSREDIRRLTEEKNELAAQLEQTHRLEKKVTKLRTKLSAERDKSQQLEDTVSRLSAQASPRASPRSPGYQQQSFQSPSQSHSFADFPQSTQERSLTQIPASPKQSPRFSPRNIPVNSPRSTVIDQKSPSQISGGQNQSFSRASLGSKERQNYSYASRDPSEFPVSPRSRMELDSFIQQIGDELDTFMNRQINWNKQRVLTTVAAIVERIDVLEKEKKQRGAATSRLSQLQGEWTTWADQLLAKYGRNYRKGMTENEMRTKIADTIAMASQKRMLDVIESLREQKQLLLSGVPLTKETHYNNEEEEEEEEPEQQKLSFSDLARASLFIAATKTIAQQTKSPTKSVAASHNNEDHNTSLSFN